MRRAWAAVVVGVAVAVACTQSQPNYTPVGTTLDGGTILGTGPIDAGPLELSCENVLICLGACADTDTTCQQLCESEATPSAWTLFSALNECVQTACPSTVGAVCNTDTTACNTCLSDAQMSGGACASDSSGCDADTSGGGPLTCVEINNCIAACSATDNTCADTCLFEGTSGSQALFENAENCLEQACPSTTGDVCATDTSACETCIDEAQTPGGSCVSAVSACDDDTG
jgi:hypothetical protein